MTPSTPFHLKHRTGGLAAGREIEHAWILLSDVAFKLFLWLCLHAERNRGSLSAAPAGLASALQRTESAMRAALDEPFRKGCNAAAPDVMEIADRFWPYPRGCHSQATDDLASDMSLEIKRLDNFAAVWIDDIGDVQQDREEMEVLLTLPAERDERRRVRITTNLVFSKWDPIFKNPMTATAAIDRLVHHAVILELNLPSYRAEKAMEKQRDPAATEAGQP